MKKILLTFTMLCFLAFSAFSQRMTLSEEFTGENCGPCAGTNPGFWSLCDTLTNPSMLIHISYMAPIPSPGWFYARTSTLEGVRESYYSVPFAPYHRYDGHVPDATASSPGHPYYFTQSDINAEAAIADSFTMVATNAWNSTYDSIVTTIKVKCTSAWSGGSSVYLRAALVQTDNFNMPPGTNGETHFENVVQAMYPSATGTSITGTWAAGDSMTYVITGAKPAFVDPSKAPYMVVWIQNDANKVISQAAKATPLPPIPNDAAISSVTGPANFTCHANGTATVSNSLMLMNAGNNTLTSATIYYGSDGGTLSSYSWTGSLAVAGTTTVTLPATSVTVSGAGFHMLYDSVAMPNGAVDQNTGNNAMNVGFFIESTTGLTAPYFNSFERADWGSVYRSDNNSNGELWMPVWSGTVTPCAHTDSFAMYYDCYQYAAGETEIFTLPEVTTSSATNLSFWTSHAYYSATPDNDMLEVVYSTDCGTTWTSIWSLSGGALANMGRDTNYFVPTPTDYVQRSTSLGSVPAGSMIAFRGTSGWGNNIFVDDAYIHNSPVGVKTITATSLNLNVFPNPAKDEATLSFSLNEPTIVQVQLIDGLGCIINTIADGNMEAGSNSIAINTSSLSTGVYNILFHTSNGTFTQRLNVIK